MTALDYSRMKAFARLDGALVAAVWTLSFAFYVMGMATPALMFVALLIGVASPVYAARRLCRYRDGVCGGALSFRRGYFYSVQVFFYAALLFAVAQFAYFQFLDGGYMVSCVASLMDDAQMREAIKTSGMEQAFNDALATMASTRPIDYALSYFTTNVILGLVLGLPIAGVARRSGAKA